MTEYTFDQYMSMASAYWGHKPEAKILGLYWSMLNQMDDEQFVRAMEELFKSFKPTAQTPFPLVAHFLESTGNSDADMARNAVMAVKKAIHSVGKYRSVDFGDRVLHGVISAYGGWAAICQWTGKEWDINESRFIESYKSARKQGNNGPEYLSGISDTHNGASGFLEHLRRPMLAYKKQDGQLAFIESKKEYSGLQIEEKKQEIKEIESIGQLINI